MISQALTRLARKTTLPKINQLVYSTSGHTRMSFLDAYLGYHQIAMHELDQEKIAFITPRRVFCNEVIPFGLQKTRATYQIMITKMFEHLISINMDAYIDDMMVKSKQEPNHSKNLARCS